MSTEATLDDYRWLIGDAAEYLQLAAAGRDELATTRLLRKMCSSERARLVVEHAALRRRAREKFALADRLFFMPLRLEQATDQWVAAYKAARFPQAAVCDLCCGIGGDLMALAAGRAALAVDADPLATLLAEANCRVTLPENSVVSFEAARANVGHVSDCSAWHIDPDRRSEGRRTSRIELGEPGPQTIDELLAVQPSGAVKLAPAARVPFDWTRKAELEWISRGRQCRQLVAWFGSLAQNPGQRRATILSPQGELLARVTDDGPKYPSDTTALDQVEEIDAFLYEVDPAVLAADLFGALETQLGLVRVDDHGGYLTGQKRVSHPALVAFEVLTAVPFDRKRVKAMLRERGIGKLEVKKRGTPHDPAKLQRELQGSGDNEATLVLLAVRRGVTAILARRVVASV